MFFVYEYSWSDDISESSQDESSSIDLIGEANLTILSEVYMGIDVDFDLSSISIQGSFEYGFLFLLELNGNIELGINVFETSVTWEVNDFITDTNYYITIFATLET